MRFVIFPIKIYAARTNNFDLEYIQVPSYYFSVKKPLVSIKARSLLKISQEEYEKVKSDKVIQLTRNKYNPYVNYFEVDYIAGKSIVLQPLKFVINLSVLGDEFCEDIRCPKMINYILFSLSVTFNFVHYKVQEIDPRFSITGTIGTKQKWKYFIDVPELITLKEETNGRCV